jgi:hypothetical protein
MVLHCCFRGDCDGVGADGLGHYKYVCLEESSIKRDGVRRIDASAHAADESRPMS